MFYKPNYCCNCGEQIERIQWNFLTSRRFCEVCETDNPLDKLLKIIFPTVLLLFSLFGISGYFQKSEKSVGIKKSENTKIYSNAENNNDSNTGRPKDPNVANVQENEDLALERKSKTDLQVAPIEGTNNTNDKPEKVIISKSPQKSVKDVVYFCGAETKKGTPCSRRVKGGGRCWQHVGREALLSAKELRTDSN